MSVSVCAFVLISSCMVLLLQLVNLDAMVENDVSQHHADKNQVKGKGKDEDEDEIDAEAELDPLASTAVVATPVDDVMISSFEIRAEPRLTCVSAWVQGVKKTSNGKKGNII